MYLYYLKVVYLSALYFSDKSVYYNSYLCNVAVYILTKTNTQPIFGVR
jgi:hypothetical protein